MSNKVRLEFVSFAVKVQSPPDVHSKEIVSGKDRMELSDYGDQTGGDGNEIWTCAIHLDEENDVVLLTSKMSGITHTVRLANVTWYRVRGERDRARKAYEDHQAALAAGESPEAQETPVPAPSKAAPPPAKKKPVPPPPKKSGVVRFGPVVDKEDAR